MEFNEKIQELRKKKGITQEELANALYVSRTAISKWESGRGYPSIDSLKTLAKFYSVTVDELLSGDELLEVANEEGRQKVSHIRDLVFGLLDMSFVLLLFLPIFAMRSAEVMQSVSLISFGGERLYLKIIYLCIVGLSALFGVATLVMQSSQSAIWIKCKSTFSVSLSAFSVLMFTASLQPYAAIFALALLLIKAIMLIKRQ